MDDVHNRTRIKTTKAMRQSCGIYATLGSRIVLEEDLFGYPKTRGFVQILNETPVTGTEAYGVKLETGSILTGAGNLTFADPDVNEGKETIPTGMQIMAPQGEGCVATD